MIPQAILSLATPVGIKTPSSSLAAKGTSRVKTAAGLQGIKARIRSVSIW
jgi:hypothetical protein